MSVTEVGTPAAPAVQTGSNTLSVGPATTPALNWSGSQPRTAGDLLVCAVSSWGGTTGGTPGTPSGWTQALTITGSSRSVVTYFTKVATGGDSAPVISVTNTGTVTFSTLAVMLFELAGEDGTTPVVTSGTATGTTANPLTVTTSGNVPASGCYALSAWMLAVNAAATSTLSAGSGWTGRADNGSTSTRAHYLFASQSPSAGSALSESAGYTTTGSFLAGAVIVVQPATSNAASLAGTGTLTAGGAETGTAPYWIGGQADPAGASTTVIAVNRAVPAGDTVLVAGTLNSTTTPAVTGVTDSKGNTYTLAASDTSGRAQWVYAAINAAALSLTDTITVSWSGSTIAKSAVAAGCGGVGAAGTVDKTATAAGTGTSASVTSATLTQASEAAFAIGTWQNGGGGAPTWSGGFAQLGIAEEGGLGGGHYSAVASVLPGSTAALTPAAGLAASAAWTMTVVTFTLATAVTGAASLAGTGTLTAAGGPAGAASLAGTGTVTAAGGLAGSASLAGTGALTASGGPAGAASLAGAGTLTASGGPAGAATLTGTGALTAATAAPGAAALSGTGALTAAAAGVAGAALSGTGTLTAAATQVIAAAATLSGTGTLTAAATQAPAAALSGTGTLTGAATAVVAAAAALSGSGALTAAAGLAPAASLAGAGNVTAGATLSQAAAASLSGTGTLTAASTQAIAAAATLSGSGTLTAAAVLTLRAALTVTSGAGSSTLAVPSLPVAVGDLIFIWVAVGDASDGFTADPGDGLTAETANSPATAMSTQLFHKIADSGDVAKAAASGSYLVTQSAAHPFSALIGVVPVTSTAHPFDPSDNPGSGQSNTASTSAAAAGITTGGGGRLLVWLGAVRAGSGAVPPAMTAPAGYTVPAGVTQANSSGTATANTGVLLAAATQPAAGATGTVAGTYTGSQVSGGLLLAVKAAPVVPIPGVVNQLVAGAPDDASFQVVAKTTGATSCRLAYSVHSDMSSPSFAAAQAPDASGYVRYTVTGLAAGTRYYCQVTDTPPGAGETLIGAVGQCKTLAAAGSPADFTVALVSCIEETDTTSPAQDTAITDWISYGADLNIFTGDFTYSGSTSTDVGTQTAIYESQIATIPSLKSMVATRWGFYCRSDHEAGPDNGDSDNTYTAANLAAAQQVFPMGVLGDTVNSPPHGLYQAWAVGRVRFIMVDIRNIDRSPGANTDNGSKTMLGATQLAWFKAQLIEPEPLKVIISDVAWMGPASTTNGPDKWWSYDTERQAILSYIAANAAQVQGLMFWHGDTHLVGCTPGSQNAYGGFPVYCAAPLLNVGGGLNTSTFTQLYDNSGGECRQYGRIAITDDGAKITVAFQGWDAISGTAKVAQTDIFQTTSGLSGTGTLTAAGSPGGTASLAGTGTLTAGGGLAGAAALAGTGALAAAGGLRGAASLSGSGTLTAAGSLAGSAALAGSGLLTASGLMVGAAALSGAGVLTAAAGQAPAAALAGAGMLTAAAQILPSAPLAGSGTLTAGGQIMFPGAAALTGTGMLAAPAVVAPAAHLAGTGTVTALAAGAGGATLAGAGTLTAAATLTAGASLAGTGALTASAGQAPAAALSGSGTLNPLAILGAAGDLAGAGVLSAAAGQAAAAFLAGAGQIHAAVTLNPAAGLAGSGTLTAAATQATAAAAYLAGTGLLAAAAIQAAAATLAGLGIITAGPHVRPQHPLRDFPLAGTATIPQAGGGVVIPGAAGTVIVPGLGGGAAPTT